MKRSVPLRRSAPLKTRRRPLVDEPGRDAWNQRRSGWCETCGSFEYRLHGHHVVYEQIVRREGGDPWSPANRMDLCASCHMAHHAAARKIPLSKVSDAALAFAVGLLGEHRAADFFRRRYAPVERAA